MMYTILIASHNRGWIDRCADALSEDGHLVRIAFSAHMAKDAVDRVPTDLVLVDDSILFGPDLDFVRSCVARPQPIKVVALTRNPGLIRGSGVSFVEQTGVEAVVKEVARALHESAPFDRGPNPTSVSVWPRMTVKSSVSAAAI